MSPIRSACCSVAVAALTMLAAADAAAAPRHLDAPGALVTAQPRPDGAHPPGRSTGLASGWMRFDPPSPQEMAAILAGLGEEIPAIGADGSGPAAGRIDGQVAAVAQVLGGDPVSMWAYVHDRIAFVPLWGLMKSPAETLASEMGTAFDQARLLSELLRASGVESRYVLSSVILTNEQLSGWLGTADPADAATILRAGGTPCLLHADEAVISHVWLEARIDGAWIALDPTLKGHQVSPAANVLTATGYRRDQFLSAAGLAGMGSADRIAGLDRQKIATQLERAADALTREWRSSAPHAYADAMLGSKSIIPLVDPDLPSSLPYDVAGAEQRFSHIPPQQSWTLQLRAAGIAYTTALADIDGARLTIFYQQTAEGAVPILRRDGAEMGRGPARPNGSLDTVAVTLRTAIPGDSGMIGTGFEQVLRYGESCAIVVRSQSVVARMVDREMNELADAVNAEPSETGEPVAGQALHALGMSYFGMVDAAASLSSRLAGVVHVPMTSILIATQDLVVEYEVEGASVKPVRVQPGGLSIDVQLSVDGAESLDGDAAALRAYMLYQGMLGSAAESAAIAQLQATDAMSTMAIMRTAADEGLPFLAVRSPAQLAALDCTPPVRQWFAEALAGGQIVIAPLSGVMRGSWEGEGWISIDTSTGEGGYMIRGDLAGGSSTRRGGIDPTSMTARSLRAARPALMTAAATAHPELDPLDPATGAFFQCLEVPLVASVEAGSLMQACYTSLAAEIDSSMGFGWSPAFDARLLFGSDWRRALGRGSAVDVAASAAAASIAMDLLRSMPPSASLAPVLASVLIADWAAELTLDNSVIAVGGPHAGAEYLELSDGTYWTGPASDSTLVRLPGGYRIDYRDGAALVFDVTGKPDVLIDPSGRQLRYRFDGAGRVTALLDDEGRASLFEYRANRLSRVVDSASAAVSLGYDGAGNLAAWTDAAGAVTRFGYDAAHRITEVIDSLGNRSVLNVYDGNDRVVEQTDGLGFKASIEYLDGQTAVAQGEAVRTYSIDRHGRIAAEVDATGAATLFEHDARDHVVSVTDATGAKTMYEYDTAGHIVAVVDAAGQRTSYSYNDSGLPVSSTDALGHQTQYVYSAGRRLERIVDPEGGETSWTYDSSGRVQSTTDPDGVTVHYEHDVHDRLTTVADGSGTRTWLASDAGDRLIRLIDPAGDTSVFGYDRVGRLVSEQHPTGGVVTYAYDLLGNPVAVVDGAGRRTEYEFDAQARLTKVVDAAGGSTGYQHNRRGSLSARIDALDRTTLLERDPADRLLAVIDQLGRRTSYSYDGARNLTRVTKADGSKIDYRFDPRGLLQEIVASDGMTSVFGYDASERLTSALTATGAEEYQYDRNGRLIRTHDSSRGVEIQKQYTAAGRLSSIKAIADGNLIYDVAYAYDQAGRLAAVHDLLGGVQATNVFTPLERLAETRVGSAVRTLTTSDGLGRPLRIEHRSEGDVPIAVFEYTYDVAGNTTAVTETLPAEVRTARFGYDALDRVTSSTSPDRVDEWSYDAVGNMVQHDLNGASTPYSYDRADQLLAGAAVTYSFDDNGNLVRRAGPEGETSFSYDVEDRLNAVQSADGVRILQTHDAFGRAISRADGATTRQTFYDGLLPMLDVFSSDSGSTSTRYVSAGALLVGATTAGDSVFYLSDASLAVRVVVDESGRALRTHAPTVFGSATHLGSGNEDPFVFLGQAGVRRDDLLGQLLLMGVRHYDAEMGRFLTRDPVVGYDEMFEPWLSNPYAYASGNPMRYADAAGLRPQLLLSPQRRMQQQAARVSRATQGMVAHPLERGPRDPTESVTTERLARNLPISLIPGFDRAEVGLEPVVETSARGLGSIGAAKRPGPAWPAPFPGTSTMWPAVQAEAW